MFYMTESVFKSWLRQGMGFFCLDALVPFTDKWKAAETAVLLIDVQEQFCAPNRDIMDNNYGNAATVRTAKAIADIAPAFRAASLKLYPVFFSEEKRTKEQIDFYRFKPEPNDQIIRKDQDSAFYRSRLDALLKKNGVKNLIVCGFNMAACVNDTVIDACQLGYNVSVVRNLVGNDTENERWRIWSRRDMTMQGAVFLSSDKVLKMFETTPAP